MPSYRIGFFDRLALRLGPGFSVYASDGDLGVLTACTSKPAWHRSLGPMRPLVPGLEWQQGALSVPVNRGDVVVVCGAPRTLSTLALILKSKVKGARTVWWGHYWSSTSRAWRYALRLVLIKMVDGVIFYTDQEVREYVSQRGPKKPRERIHALNNGIETGEIVRLRAPYDAATRPRDLLFIGRLTEKSELGVLLDALAMPRCQDVSLDVIGAGLIEDALRKRAGELGLSDRVRWHGGTTDEYEIAAVANRCKLFVYPGAVGLSLIHALSYGLPTIVHDARWAHMPEIAALRPGANGLVFECSEATSLATVVAGALANPAQLNSMSDSAIETTKNSYNAEDMADRFCAAINKIARHDA